VEGVADKLKTLIPGLTAVDMSTAGVLVMPLMAVMVAVGECRRKGDLTGGTA